jgi:hypothetical protein
MRRIRLYYLMTRIMRLRPFRRLYDYTYKKRS